MSRSRRRSGGLRPVPLTISVAAAVAVAAAAVLVSRSDLRVTIHDAADSAAELEASYQAGASWDTGYSGQYTITNRGTTAVTGWTLGFMLPKGTTLSSLWNGSYTDYGDQVTVTSDGWDGTVQPGGTVTVGFVTASSGEPVQPANCTVNGAPCQAGGAGAAGTAPVRGSAALA
jgi:chitinase